MVGNSTKVRRSSSEAEGGNVANQREHLILPLANVGIRNKAREAYEQSAKVIENSKGARTTPSVVAFNQRGTSLALRQALFFTTKPYPCDPSTLPKYPPSKEFDTKLRDEEARRWQTIFQNVFLVFEAIYVNCEAFVASPRVLYRWF
ncbi:hypothetical protein IFM89_016093 [Coptis chinensis]|uniref:Uncharacterized protein n=1 Tax=Coptis chinensis TaxID=261450 RepID=A0A835HVY4_9MAGN|nr:hypothetical protein IFM89_016093 [Coptis chinensis]